MKISVYDINGKETEKIDLPEIFETKINNTLLAQAVRVYLANKRQGTAAVKTRGEVEGSSRKIYRQKGTGRARHGSIRANIFRKGGVVFGPEPREFRLGLPQKMRRAALYSALASRLNENAITVIDGLDKIEPKTKKMAGVLTNLKLTPSGEKILLVLDKAVKNIILSARNIKDTTITNKNLLDAYIVLNNKKIVFTKDAVLSFEPKEKAKVGEEPVEKKEAVKKETAVKKTVAKRKTVEKKTK